MRPLPEIRGNSQTRRRPTLDLSISSNLYLTDEQGEWFEAVLNDPEYKDTVETALDGGEDALLPLLDRVKLSGSHRRVTIVDCGPASIGESIRKLQKLMRSIFVAQYIVIDMNAHLLSKIKDGVASTLGVPTRFLQSRFEDVTHDLLADAAADEILLLFGSTEMNYEPDELANVLQRFCPPRTLLALEGLLRTGEGSVVGYQSDAVKHFAFGPLWLLGATEEQFEFNPVFLDDRIVLEFIAKASVEFASNSYPPLASGDTAWTAFSRRPTAKEHRQSLAQIGQPIGFKSSDPRILTSLSRLL